MSAQSLGLFKDQRRGWCLRALMPNGERTTVVLHLPGWCDLGSAMSIASEWYRVRKPSFDIAYMDAVRARSGLVSGPPTFRDGVSVDSVPPIAGVYFLQDGPAVKIGVSSGVDRRAFDLQAGNPRPLTLVAFAPDHTEADERAIHQDLADARIHREWFRMTPKVVAYIDEARRMWPLEKYCLGQLAVAA